MLKHANPNIVSIPLLKSIERFEQCASLARLDDTLIDQAVEIVEQKLKDKAKISLRKGGYAAYATTKDWTLPKRQQWWSRVTSVNQEYVKKKRAIAGNTGIVFSSPEDCDLANQISADKVAALYG